MATAELKRNATGFKVSLQQQPCPLSFRRILCFLLFWDSNDVCKRLTSMHQISRCLDNQADPGTPKLTWGSMTSLGRLGAVITTLIKRDSLSSPELLISFVKARFKQGPSNLLISSHDCFVISCANMLLCSSDGISGTRLNIFISLTSFSRNAQYLLLRTSTKAQGSSPSFMQKRLPRVVDCLVGRSKVLWSFSYLKMRSEGCSPITRSNPRWKMV